MTRLSFDQIVERHKGYFFSKDTMRFFGDKMSSFGVEYRGSTTYLYRKPTVTVNVFGTKRRVGREFFNAWEVDIDGDIHPVDDDTKDEIYERISA